MRVTSALAAAGLCLGAIALVVIAGAPGRDGVTPPFGFSRESGRAQLALERRFLSEPDPSRIREAHRILTSSPHPAGSRRNRELADWVLARFRDAGMEDVEIIRHDVLLPQPVEIAVEMTHPRAWRASMREAPADGDPDTHADPAVLGQPYHAYSASGEVTAPVVFAGNGDPADYDWLAARGVDVRGAIVLVRYATPYSYRGFKVLTAEQRGAAGILIYSDPAVAGSARGTPYPDGPWAPDTLIERGGVGYDFLAPGDPLTPGWASVPGAKRIARADAVSLPNIPSVPLSASDARPILEALEGPIAPEGWQGALPLEYRVGAGPARVRMLVRTDDAIRPIWTVTGMFRGSQSPDDVVIVGNHRDAWLYGGVDPSSGTAVLVELARAFGELGRGGWRPGRSILFASWDAEELALISSTEWGEQHEAWLGDRAVAYLNVDSAASGQRFVAAAVPSLARLVAEVAQSVRDPASGIPVAALARERRSAERGRPPDGTPRDIVGNRIGGGSDHTVFLNFLGVPVADLSFAGPYGVYHSVYDTHRFVARFADPGFRYHAAMVQIWGLAALRLAAADALPLDPASTAAAITGFIRDVEPRLPPGTIREDVLGSLRTAAAELAQAALDFGRARDSALERNDRTGLARLNRRILGFERAFLDPLGLPGRPWYRHLVHAPTFTYAPEILPGISTALDAGDEQLLLTESARLAAAFRRAAIRLRGE